MKKLAHINEDFTLTIDNKTPEQIIDEIHAAGYSIGRTSLNMLLAGTCFQAGCFEMINAKFRTKDKKPAPQIKVNSDVNIQEIKKPHKITELKPIKQKHETQLIKSINPDSVLVGSKNAMLFEMLASPNGASKEEIMERFGWNQSCWAAILYSVPKSKGYTVVTAKEEVTHTLRYHLYFSNGAGKVRPDQILYRERKSGLTTQQKELRSSKRSTMSVSAYNQRIAAHTRATA